MKLLWFPLESYISYVAPSSNVICMLFNVVLSDDVCAGGVKVMFG